jgi:hypothetical protein
MTAQQEIDSLKAIIQERMENPNPDPAQQKFSLDLLNKALKESYKTLEYEKLPNNYITLRATIIVKLQTKERPDLAIEQFTQNCQYNFPKVGNIEVVKTEWIDTETLTVTS